MKFTRSYSKTVTTPPGTFKHGKNEPVNITFIEYDEATYKEDIFYYGDKDAPLKNVAIEEKLKEFASAKDGKNRWINIDGVQNESLLEQLGKDLMNVHSLTLEDVVHTDQRPKYENFETYDSMILRFLRRDAEGMTSEQISMILMNNFLVTFHEIPSSCFLGVIERLKKSNGRIRKKNADYLAYALLDAIVDSYFVIMESLEADIDVLDKELIENPTQNTLIKIHSLKTELLQIKKTVSPMREMINSMERTDRNFIDDRNNVFLRDAQDHVLRILETAESMRDMLFGMMDVYMSNVSMRLNEVMKVLTIISTVFIPITFITSVYGMNFDGIQEIHFKYGYEIVWGVMIAVAGSLIYYFKNKKWL